MGFHTIFVPNWIIFSGPLNCIFCKEISNADENKETLSPQTFVNERYVFVSNINNYKTI